MGFDLLVAFAIAIVSALLSAAMTPKPKVQDAVAGRLDIPTADEGGEIPVIFGDVLVKSPNVIWYGDARTEAIRSSGGGKK